MDKKRNRDEIAEALMRTMPGSGQLSNYDMQMAQQAAAARLPSPAPIGSGQLSNYDMQMAQRAAAAAPSPALGSGQISNYDMQRAQAQAATPQPVPGGGNISNYDRAIQGLSGAFLNTPYPTQERPIDPEAWRKAVEEQGAADEAARTKRGYGFPR